jgi:hypothetical protein
MCFPPPHHLRFGPLNPPAQEMFLRAPDNRSLMRTVGDTVPKRRIRRKPSALRSSVAASLEGFSRLRRRIATSLAMRKSDVAYT